MSISTTGVKSSAARIASSWIAQPGVSSTGINKAALVRHISTTSSSSPSLSTAAAVRSLGSSDRLVCHPSHTINTTNTTKLYYSTTSPSSSSTPQNPSSSSGGFLSSLKNKFSPSSSSSTPSTTTAKPDPRYAEQFRTMAESPTWALSDVSKQLQENIDSLGGWKSYVPGISTKSKIEAIKGEKDMVDAAIAVLTEGEGGMVVLEDLKCMSRKDRLRICLESKSSTSTISTFIENFESMTILHRILRFRLETGKALPVDEEEAKRMMQMDFKDVLSVRERKDMQKRMMRKGGR